MSEDYWGRIDKLLASIQVSINRIDVKCDTICRELRWQTWMLMGITGLLGVAVIVVVIVAMMIE